MNEHFLKDVLLFQHFIRTIWCNLFVKNLFKHDENAMSAT